MGDDIEQIRKKMAEQLVSGAGKNTAAAGKPQTLNDSSFSDFISGPGLSVVDFWAVWCAPCRFVSPIIEELSREYSGRVRFGKLNVDENQVTSGRYGIRSIPTIMLFRNGKPVDSIIGALPRNQIESRIVQNMQQ